MFWRKIDIKIERKSLEEKLEELENSLSVQDKSNVYSRLARNTHLARKKDPRRSPKTRLAQKTRVKHEFA